VFLSSFYVLSIFVYFVDLFSFVGFLDIFLILLDIF